MRTVAYHHCHLERGVEFLKHAAGNIYTCQYTFFFYNQMLTAHCIGAYGAQCCVVAVAYIFGKR